LSRSAQGPSFWRSEASPNDPRRARELGRPAARAIHAASWLFIGAVSSILGVQLLPV